MRSDTFVSYAQNGEDVVLRRALGGLKHGTYVDVGANDPRYDSVTWSFYRSGWRGITVEPLDGYVALQREVRPGDVQVQAVAAPRTGDEVVFHEIPGTGLSTMVAEISDRHGRSGLEVREVTATTVSLDDVFETSRGRFGTDVHLLCVDVEGFEADVLAGLDLTRNRPWVVVVEARAPLSVDQESYFSEFLHDAWEPRLLDSGYRFCLNDGVSRFYVAEEHHATLGAALSYPACVLDDWVDYRYAELNERYQTARGDAIRWRGVALEEWVAASLDVGADLASTQVHAAHLEREIAAMRGTLSWRVTAPLRWVRNRQVAGGTG